MYLLRCNLSIVQQACIVWLLKKKKRKEENTEDVAGVRCAPRLRTATADLPGLPAPFEVACAHISRDDGPYRLFTVVQPPDLLTPRACHTRTHANHLRRAVARPTRRQRPGPPRRPWTVPEAPSPRMTRAAPQTAPERSGTPPRQPASPTVASQ